MIRGTNLIEHLPPCVQDYREIKEIIAAENPEFQTIEDETEVIKNNQFIQSCDLKGIERFERILKILPSIGDTLEMRKFRALSRWNDRIPYTFKSLQQKLNTLCGDYSLELNADECLIVLQTHLGVFGTIDELLTILSIMIPCNMEVIVSNVLIANSDSGANVGCQMISAMHYIIS